MVRQGTDRVAAWAGFMSGASACWCWWSVLQANKLAPPLLLHTTTTRTMVVQAPKEYCGEQGATVAAAASVGTRRRRGEEEKRPGVSQSQARERVFQSFWAEEGPRNTIQGETSAPGWLLEDF